MNVGFDPVGCTNSIGVLCGEARGRSPGRGSVVVSVVGGFLFSCRLCTSWLEHDDVAGTKRGPNTIFRFTLDGLRICHFGDFGQAELRAEQQRAIGDLDVLFLPVGGGPTVGGESAAAIVRTLRPRLVVPMHYRTSAVNFLEPPDAFLDARVDRLDGSSLETEQLLGTADPTDRRTARGSRVELNGALRARRSCRE